MENSTSKTWIIWAVVVIVVVIVVGFVIKNSGPKENQVAAPVAGDESALPVTINVKHLYLNGAHTYRGIVETPTPCYDVLTGVVLAQEQAVGEDMVTRTINITTKDKGMNCGQVVTDKEFKVSFNASEGVTVNAMLNGSPAILNVMEVESEAELDGAFDFKS